MPGKYWQPGMLRPTFVKSVSIQKTVVYDEEGHYDFTVSFIRAGWYGKGRDFVVEGSYYTVLARVVIDDVHHLLCRRETCGLMRTSTG